MLRFWYCVLTSATIVASHGPASAQTPPATPPAEAQTESGQSVAPAGAHSYFVNLRDGDTVTSPFKVVFGLSPNMGIAPAGVDKPNVGHHHLIIDTTLSPEELTQPIPVDEQHIHFGKGQTETTLKLPPGRHTLQLVLGNWSHIPFAPGVQSEIITIYVKDEAVAANAEAAKAQVPAAAAAATPTPATVGMVKSVKHAHMHHHRHLRHYRYVSIYYK